MNILNIVLENHLEESFSRCMWGLERESLRTVGQKLALTPHPKSLGSRRTHPYIQTDYSDSQPEVITPPLSPISLAYSWMIAVTSVLSQSLAEDEYLWPLSMPCLLPKDESLIPISTYTSQEVKQYRQETGKKYGRKRQVITGIHVNFSLPDDLLWKLYQAQSQIADEKEFKNHIYLKIARNFLTYQWLLVYLFGASPIAYESFFDAEFYEDLALVTHPVRSLRNSVYGFQNKEEVNVRYDSVEGYAKDIQRAVKQGLLEEEREFYANIRLRHPSGRLTDLVQEGIQYLEFRIFDIDPFSPYGLDEKQIIFIYAFILTMLLMPSVATNDEVRRGQRKVLQVAGQMPEEKVLYVEEGEIILDQMNEIIKVLNCPETFSQWLNQFKEQLHHPEQTLSFRVLQAIEEVGSYLSFGEEMGKRHQKFIQSMGDQWPGFDGLWPGQRQKISHTISQGISLSVMNEPLAQNHREHFTDWLEGNIR